MPIQQAHSPEGIRMATVLYKAKTTRALFELVQAHGDLDHLATGGENGVDLLLLKKNFSNFLSGGNLQSYRTIGSLYKVND